MPTDPNHPRSTAAGIGGALSIVILALLPVVGAHPTPAESGAITTIVSYFSSLLPVGRFGS